MILYAIICRAKDAEVLVECSIESVSGNVSQAYIALVQYLKDNRNLVPSGKRRTFVQHTEAARNTLGVDEDGDFDFWNFFEAVTGCSEDGLDYFFHVYCKDDIFYCCLSDDADIKEQKVSFAFLEHVQTEFTKKYNSRKIDNAKPGSMNESFSPELRSSIHHYNINHVALSQDAKVRALTVQIDDLKSIMGNNLTLLIERGEDIEKLMDKSEEMKRDSMVFRRKSKKVHKKISRKSLYVQIVMVVGVLFMIYIIAAGACGVTFSQCKSSSNS
mmetsp:Transcript_9792/g.15040  ORF Transcript_9792/g.15040 Transcript_9792/m.15040 type:complete len:272 (-) Transcript_9792:135-950(-)|eukprot:CAMPEP_0195297230 /NCGR_PEP_ID=MMETSP0707-20130614/21101_1 /TAXON_ID=33640 /ORGANISM="Asterionellopsis glacialis, Strain CCMP134" /LENGTH=271 /DNA_ID=CAMNT_0040358983 /DNA_START=174 /DNA_END=989 /DNA_ORIENTATION=+